MTDRILDLSEAPARLRVRYDQLVVERPNEPQAAVPLAELAVVLIAHPQVSITHAVLAGLMSHGGALVACDQRNLPVGMLLPLVAHSTQTETFAAQARASTPLKKRLWQHIVRAKLKAQAATLRAVHGDDGGLGALVAMVRSGDPHNIEAQASGRYWPRLFNDPHYRRGTRHKAHADPRNLLLNYGYAVLRAIVGRAICAAGLHPSLGLHHHNRYDAYCLADDLMEPLRPLVDRAVVEYLRDHPPPDELDGGAKRHILGSLAGRCRLNGQQRTLFDAAARMAASLAQVFRQKTTKLLLPEC
jgi:CRISPR-associated protein Cas1